MSLRAKEITKACEKKSCSRNFMMKHRRHAIISKYVAIVRLIENSVINKSDVNITSERNIIAHQWRLAILCELSACEPVKRGTPQRPVLRYWRIATLCRNRRRPWAYFAQACRRQAAYARQHENVTRRARQRNNFKMKAIMAKAKWRKQLAGSVALIRIAIDSRTEQYNCSA